MRPNCSQDPANSKSQKLFVFFKVEGERETPGEPYNFWSTIYPAGLWLECPLFGETFNRTQKNMREYKKEYERIQKRIFNRSVSKKNFLLNLTTSVS
jgi:hypothetical protein